jgi:polyphosphate kinase
MPGVPGMSENINVTRIVDRYLEHGRIFIFNNDNNREIFMGSSDWMNRNIHHRIEVCFPVQDEKIKDQLEQLIAMQLNDTVKAVALTAEMENYRVSPINAEKIRSQEAIYHLM